MAKGLIAVLKFLKAEREKGSDLGEEIDKISGGFYNPNWAVLGNVNQANRDVVINNIRVVMGEYSDKLELPPSAKPIRVPVLLVVMTAGQVQELENGDAFLNVSAVLKDDFDQHLKPLLEEEAPGWLMRYGAAPESWMPFEATPGEGEAQPENLTIAKLVQQAFDLANQKGDFDPLLEPDFKGILEVENDQLFLSRARSKGCIAIIDIVSMRHPLVQRAFHRSLIDAYRKTSILTLAPNSHTFVAARDLAVVIQLKLAEMEFLRRQVDTLADANTFRNVYDDQFDKDSQLVQFIRTRVEQMSEYHPESKLGAPTFSRNE